MTNAFNAAISVYTYQIVPLGREMSHLKLNVMSPRDVVLSAALLFKNILMGWYLNDSQKYDIFLFLLL